MEDFYRKGQQLGMQTTEIANAMQRITEALRNFVSRHETDFHLERFRAGWRTLSDVLARRIESEERTLYPLYEQRVLRKA